jgi:hypothetical protein
LLTRSQTRRARYGAPVGGAGRCSRRSGGGGGCFSASPRTHPRPGRRFRRHCAVRGSAGDLFVGALPKNSRQSDASIALLCFLSSTEATTVITKAGLKPVLAR